MKKYLIMLLLVVFCFLGIAAATGTLNTLILPSQHNSDTPTSQQALNQSEPNNLSKDNVNKDTPNTDQNKNDAQSDSDNNLQGTQNTNNPKDTDGNTAPNAGTDQHAIHWMPPHPVIQNQP